MFPADLAEEHSFQDLALVNDERLDEIFARASCEDDARQRRFHARFEIGDGPANLELRSAQPGLHRSIERIRRLENILSDNNLLDTSRIHYRHYRGIDFNYGNCNLWPSYYFVMERLLPGKL